MNAYRSVLDHGFVELVDYMGDDYRILQSARVSTGGEASKGDVKDKGLIRYLYKNEHLTPFEQVVTTWHIKCPIFVARQWMRHRTMSFNEYSARYSEMIEDAYIPEEVRGQATVNHQGSEGVIDDADILNQMESVYDNAMSHYKSFLNKGVAKEIARSVLPVGQYTEFYFTVNLRNLFHFLELRLDSHAQYEIRVYAEAILNILNDLERLKWSMEVFSEFSGIKTLFRDSINVSGKNTDKLKELLQNYISEIS